MRRRLSQALISEGGKAAELCAIQYRTKAYVTFRAGFVRSAQHDGTAALRGAFFAVRHACCPSVPQRPPRGNPVILRADRVTAQSAESRFSCKRAARCSHKDATSYCISLFNCNILVLCNRRRRRRSRRTLRNTVQDKDVRHVMRKVPSRAFANVKRPHKAVFLRWRKRRDSNSRTVARHRISSAARYDHFDTLPSCRVILQYRARFCKRFGQA